MIIQFRNAGAGKCTLIKQKREYILVASEDKQEFIVATYLCEDGSWSWGAYFKSLDDALAEFNNRVGG